MQRILHFILIPALFVIFFFSCKKHEMDVTKLKVSITPGSDRCTLSWDAPQMSDFKNINIYRSSNAIPDPTFSQPIDVSLLIGTISDRTVTSFTDSNLIMNNNGMSYYRVVVNFGSRFLVSDQLILNRNGFTIQLSSNSSNLRVVEFPEVHRLYVLDYNIGTLQSIDYITRQAGLAIPISAQYNSIVQCVMHNGVAEVFSATSSTISCYDALTLAYKYSIYAPSVINSFCVKGNYMYACANSYLYTYDLTSHSLLNTKTINNSSSGSSMVFAGYNNSVYVKYQANKYYSGYYYYINEVDIYKLVNGIPYDSSYISSPFINSDSTNSNLNTSIYMLNASPDGKYFTVSETGAVYSMLTKSVSSVQTTANPSPNPVYSRDGQYLSSRPANNFFNTYSVDIFSLPGFNYVKTLRSPNLQASSTVSNDFPIHDTLLSYDLEQVFVGNQQIRQLTVLFNKIN